IDQEILSEDCRLPEKKHACDENAVEIDAGFHCCLFEFHARFPFAILVHHQTGRNGEGPMVLRRLVFTPNNAESEGKTYQRSDGFFDRQKRTRKRWHPIPLIEFSLFGNLHSRLRTRTRLVAYFASIARYLLMLLHAAASARLTQVYEVSVLHM